MRLERLLANLGYGSRREALSFINAGRLTRRDGTPVDDSERVPHGDLLFDDEPLDPAAPFTLILNKPTGYICTHADEGDLVLHLFPDRFMHRNPPLSTVGRLDKETSGLLLLTDDGGLLHRIISPRKEVPKTYEATLARPLRGDEGETFASGVLMLEGESSPCHPARLEILEPTRALLTVTEGRYHQVRRMFAAVGNHVEKLHRRSVGSLTLGDLAPGEWRQATEDDLKAVFTQPADK